MSITSKTEKRREIRRKNNGKTQKAARQRAGTPPFPIHPEQAEAKPAATETPKKTGVSRSAYRR